MAKSLPANHVKNQKQKKPRYPARWESRTVLLEIVLGTELTRPISVVPSVNKSLVQMIRLLCNLAEDSEKILCEVLASVFGKISHTYCGKPKHRHAIDAVDSRIRCCASSLAARSRADPEESA